MIDLLQIRRRGAGASIWRVLFWWTLLLWILRLWFFIFYRHRRSGVKCVPKTGPFIIAANHQSNFDPILVGALAHDRLFISIARDSLFKSKFLAFMMQGFGVIPVRRGESDTKAIRGAIAVLEKGQGILLFPEGTRSQDGSIGQFQRGLWLLIKKSQAPVLPFAIEGTFDVWPIGTSPKLSGYVESCAGELIPADTLLGMGEKRGSDFIKGEIESLRKQCRESIISRSK